MMMADLHTLALPGEFAVNHYANEAARGPSEEEEEKEGPRLGSAPRQGNQCSVPVPGSL